MPSHKAVAIITAKPWKAMSHPKTMSAPAQDPNRPGKASNATDSDAPISAKDPASTASNRSTTPTTPPSTSGEHL